MVLIIFWVVVMFGVLVIEIIFVGLIFLLFTQGILFHDFIIIKVMVVWVLYNKNDAVNNYTKVVMRSMRWPPKIQIVLIVIGDH